MKTITIKGRHYIWRPSVLLYNILKGTCICACAGGFAWAMLVFLTGGPIC